VDGAPNTFGHVVVDEAQDLTPLGLRAVARRTPARSLTVLGDLAQATAPGSVRSWDEALAALGAAQGSVAHLTVGYRVPGPVLALAERLLPLAGVVVPGSRPARIDGSAPRAVVDPELWPAVAAALRDLRSRHALSGVIVPDARHQAAVAALAELGLRPAGRIDHLQPDEVPVLPASSAKGLELDGVVVADPAGLLALGEPGARLLYIALTRAVQELVLVSEDPLPAVLQP
jgi:DNA helicase IV